MKSEVINEWLMDGITPGLLIIRHSIHSILLVNLYRFLVLQKKRPHVAVGKKTPIKSQCISKGTSESVDSFLFFFSPISCFCP